MLLVNVATVALLASFTNAQVRTLVGFIGPETGCGGNALRCEPLGQNACCAFPGISFGSATIADPNPDRLDEINGAIPVAGTSGNPCGPIVARGRGGDCITGGPNGFSSFGWARVSNAKMARATDTTNPGNVTKTLVFADGVAFALDDLTSNEQAQIVAVAMSSVSSADVPSDPLKAQL